MKVLIQTLGSAGDTHPFLAIGEALADRGHEVLVFANELFADRVKNAGLTFVELGDAELFRRIAENPDVWHPRKSADAALRPVVDHLELSIELIESHLGQASVLVNSTLGFAARILGEVHDIPVVTAHLAPNVFRSNTRLPKTEVMPVTDRSPLWMKRAWWRLFDGLVDRVVGPKLNEARAVRGLEPVRRIFDEWCIYSPDRTLGLFPDWFGPPQPDWKHPVVLTGFPLYEEGDNRKLDEDLSAWLEDGDPPVIFTAGSSNLHAGRFFETATWLCAELSIRGVLATANMADVPDDLPETVRHERWVPFDLLLPRSRALVSHGGIGTTARAIAAGIPQLVAHVNFDQRDNGSRISDLGAGGHLPMKRFRGNGAKRAITTVLTEGPRSRARQLRSRINRSAALSAACDEIESCAVGT